MGNSNGQQGTSKSPQQSSQKEEEDPSKFGFQRTKTMKKAEKTEKTQDNQQQLQLSDQKDKKDTKREEQQQSYGYVFTINGKSMKEFEDQQNSDDEQQESVSDVLLTTEIREGNTPQLSEDDDDEMELDHVIDKKDISLADLGDSMVGDKSGSRRMTLNKAITIRKCSTLKKKLDQKQIIHCFDSQSAREYFDSELSKQLTMHQSQKLYNKATTLFVPEL